MGTQHSPRKWGESSGGKISRGGIENGIREEVLQNDRRVASDPPS
jgi:hypothetical protein